MGRGKRSTHNNGWIRNSATNAGRDREREREREREKEWRRVNGQGKRERETERERERERKKERKEEGRRENEKERGREEIEGEKRRASERLASWRRRDLPLRRVEHVASTQTAAVWTTAAHPSCLSTSSLEVPEPTPRMPRHCGSSILHFLRSLDREIDTGEESG